MRFSIGLLECDPLCLCPQSTYLGFLFPPVLQVSQVYVCLTSAVDGEPLLGTEEGVLLTFVFFLAQRIDHKCHSARCFE